MVRVSVDVGLCWLISEKRGLFSPFILQLQILTARVRVGSDGMTRNDSEVNEFMMLLSCCNTSSHTVMSNLEKAPEATWLVNSLYGMLDIYCLSLPLSPDDSKVWSW